MNLPITNGTIAVSDLIEYAKVRAEELRTEAQRLPISDERFDLLGKANGFLMLATECGLAALKAKGRAA